MFKLQVKHLFFLLEIISGNWCSTLEFGSNGMTRSVVGRHMFHRDGSQSIWQRALLLWHNKSFIFLFLDWNWYFNVRRSNFTYIFILFQKIVHHISSLSNSSDHLLVTEIGDTPEGRPLQLVKICMKRNCGRKPAVWIDAGFQNFHFWWVYKFIRL